MPSARAPAGVRSMIARGGRRGVLFGPEKRAAGRARPCGSGNRVRLAGDEQGGEAERREDRAGDEGGRGANLLPQKTGDQACQEQG
jgi:hypothetical protein